MAGKLLGGAIQSGTISTTQISSTLNATIQAGGGPKVSQLIYPGDDLAANTVGGQTIYITGSGFVANSNVYINGNVAPSVTYISSSNLAITTPALSSATYPVYVINPEDGATAIFIPGLQVSGEPTWVTSTITDQDATGTWNISLSATGDAPLTYALAAGSSLPGGISLASNGVISGTITSPPEADTTYNFTVVASDAQNQDSSRTFNVTATTGEGALFANNVLLIHADGTNNQNNHTFLDSSDNNFTITRNGNASQGTFSPFSQTGWSYFFSNSNTDYINFAANAALSFASDFTLEAWVYNNYSSGTFTPAILTDSSSGAISSFEFNNGTNYPSIAGQTTQNTVNRTNLTGAILPNQQWSHVAFVRSSGVVRVYINGTVGASTLSNSATTGQIVQIGNGRTSGSPWNGYISNLRITSSAVYTSNFTPSTTPLTAISGTQLLTCQSNRFRDVSTNALSATIVGTPSVQAFSPFAPTAAYSTSLVGGSVYLDGSGDYLETTSSQIIPSGNFTIEAWAYITSSSSTQTIVAQGTGVGDGARTWMGIENSSGAKWAVQVGGTQAISSVTPVLNTWHYLAMVYNGSTIKMYLNGTEIASASSTTNASNTTLKIGTNWSSYITTGFLSNIRISNTARTISAVPSSLLTADASTVFLANFTNAGIFDQTAKNVIETVGGAVVSTADYKYGSASMYFDGTNDYLTIPSNSLFAMGTGDFTIETWFKKTSNSTTVANSQILIDFRSAEPSVAPLIDILGNGGFANDGKLEYWVNGGARILTNTAITLNTWYHLAVVRNNSNTKLYLNGTEVGNTTFSDTNNYSTTTLRIGGRFAATSGDFRSFYGYLDDLRITKGYARYTSNFTAPVAKLKDK